MGRLAGIFGLVLLVVLAGAVVTMRCEGTPPSVEAPARVVLGRDGQAVRLAASDGRAGVRSLSVVLAHAGGEAALGEARFPGRWSPLGEPRAESVEFRIEPKRLGLEDGEATLRVSARDHSWRSWLEGNEARLEIPVVIDSRPPRVSLEPGITYAKRGGAVALVYAVSEETERDGVEVGERFFPGVRLGVADAPAQRAAGARLALFPLPIDAPDAKPLVVAVDVAGNRAQAIPQVRIQERALPEASLVLPPVFLQEKIGELADAVGVDGGDRLAAFREINTRIRAENEKRIREIAGGATPELLFQGSFEQLANSKVTSPFAEQRNYFVDGQKVSQSVHYGYDLASLAGSPVTASNAGRVVFAEELGIYGQCAIVDHGLGLHSLYGHLSSLDVQAGDPVQKGQVLGLSGQTGLAGGDHLHFAMLLHGVYVDPVEWWDPKWLTDRFEPKLAAARR
jgi:murein DD-endopeptidase MepM/ murein hydrolase activator NlpD